MDRDYSSIFTIKEIYENAIGNYFDKEKLSMSTIGDLGMFVDVNSSTTEDMLNITCRYINETIPGRAELPDFIHAEAANYGISNILAVPSTMSMLLLVKEDNVIEYGKAVGDHKEFTIDADMSILVDDLPFSIPYDIKIRSTVFNGEYNHMSYYDVNYNNSIVSEDVPFIKTMKTVINGDIWLVLRVNIYQYQRIKVTEPITTNSKLNIPFIDLSFYDQLCNFEVFYTPPGSTEKIQLEKRSDKQQAILKPFVFYKLTGDDSIRFSFANDDRYFMPEYNSTITIYVYQTNGSKGNIPHNPTGIDVYIKADTENESIEYNRSIFPQGITQGNSTGGIDQLTLDKIKLLTSEKKVTVNSYTTDNDLNMYFNNFASIYNHKATFVKQRDDYAGRSYGCFIRISDGEDIVPFNTLNLKLETNDIDTHIETLRQYIVKPGTVFKYANDKDNNLLVRKKPDDEDDDIEYALAPLMIITTKPNKINFYLNTVDKMVDVDYNYFNLDSIFNFVVNSCSITRDAIHGDDQYHLELILARVDGVFNNIDSNDFSMQPTNGDIDLSKMEVLILFNTNEGDYVRMTYEENENNTNGETHLYKFVADIGTTDMIDNGRILITDLLKRADDTSDERLLDMLNPDLKFSVFYKYDNPSTHEYNDISIVREHTLCNVYTPRTDEFYFAYPLDLIRSNVVFEDSPNSDDGFSFFIKQVPMFGKDFILNNEDIGDILYDISSEHTFLSNIVDSLHGLFTINMKFYNTYGRSNNFYIGYGKDHERLNHVNCKVSLGIKFYEGIIQEDYILPIKKYIKDFFEKINELNNGTNQAYISVLEQSLHNNFSDQIKYCIFYSINDYDSKYQIIETISDMNNNSNPDFVPEYLTLKTDDIIITAL